MNVVLHTANMSNASASLSSGFSTTEGLIGPLLVVLWTILIIGLLATVRSSTYFERLLGALSLVGTAVYYAIHGLATLTAVAIVMAPAYLVATANSSARAAVGKYALYGLVAFALLAAVGYLSRHYLIEPAMRNADEAGLLPEPSDEDEEVPS